LFTKIKSPFNQGKKLSIPQLLIDFDGEWRPFDDEVLLLPDCNLVNCDTSFSDSELSIKVNAGQKGLIDIDALGNVYSYDAQTIQSNC
jgi:hypothetical protein